MRGTVRHCFRLLKMWDWTSISMRDQNQPLNYYEVLGVLQDASTDEIRSAYRREAMKWHPDRNNDPNAPRMMQLVNRAWETLGDPEKRAQHDREIAERSRSRAADHQRDPFEEFNESILPWLLERAIDLYDALGVSINATFEEIDSAYVYRQQTIEGNPNFAGDPAASAFMNLVRIAHTVLSDPEFRAEYDRHYFLMRSRFAEEERARQEAARREFERQERERQREQARRETEARRQHEEAERRKRREREKRRVEELRAREEAQRRWHERRQTENQYRRERERQSSAQAQHGGSTTRRSSPSPDDQNGHQALNHGSLVWSLVGLAIIIVTIPFILLWLNREEESPRSETVRPSVIATRTPRPSPPPPRPTATPIPRVAAARSSNPTPSPTIIPTVANTNTPTPTATYAVSPAPIFVHTPTAAGTPRPTPTRVTTSTPTSTNTPTPIFKLTETPVPPPTATSSPSPEPTATPTRTPTAIPTPTPEPAVLTELKWTGSPTILHDQLANRQVTAETVQLLIDAGAPLDSKDQHGRTPIEYAVHRGWGAQILRTLLNAGSDISNSPTILHDLLANCQISGLYGLLANCQVTTETVQLLIDAGAPLDSKDQQGRTPIEYAVHRRWETQILQTLIDAGSDISKSPTILHDLLANRYVTPEDVKLLIDAGASLHSRDQNGRTPIELAAYLGQNAEVLRMLIDAGAQVP